MPSPTRGFAKVDYLWALAAQALNVGSGLILLPIVLRYLDPGEVGLWFVFLALGSLAQLLELGFQPTLVRSTAYVYAGARSLSESGLPPREELHADVSTDLLASLVSASKTIYMRVAALASVVMLGIGTAYVYSLIQGEMSTASNLAAWITFSLGYIATFYFGYFTALLQGRGDVTRANQVTIAARSVFLILGVAGLMLGLELLGLGLASLVAGVVSRFIAHAFVYNDARMKIVRAAKVPTETRGAVIRTLWPNARRMGAVQVGAFLMQRGNILIASSALGLAAAASYGMTVTVLGALLSLAMVMCQMRMPSLSAMQMSGVRRETAAVYGRILIETWSIFLLGLFVVLLFGDIGLAAISSRTFLLPEGQLAILGVVLLLELNHGVAASYLTTINKIPFVAAAVLSGIAVALVSLLLVQPLGVAGLILAQGAVQFAYNNWKWPREALRHLQLGPLDVLRLGRRDLLGK